MDRSKLFFGGVPTAPDVKKLEDRFGIPSASSTVTHEDIAGCIGSPWKSARYGSVMGSWRKKLMREHNVDTVVVPGVGVKFLTGSERINVSESDFGSAVRKTRKAANRIMVVPDDGLSDIEKKKRDHVCVIASRSYMVMATERRAIKGTSAPEAMPRKSAEGTT